MEQYCVYKTDKNKYGIERGRYTNQEAIFISNDEREVIAFYCGYLRNLLDKGDRTYITTEFKTTYKLDKRDGLYKKN